MTTTRSKTKAPCVACGQTSCASLACLSRPRFFSGQLLTEETLNHFMDYVREKNRLHNRLLHGWGTVCGLEVSCHECPDHITLHPGYALDPCGNDILVCEPDVRDVFEMIEACLKEEERPDCLPPLRANTRRCFDTERTFCLKIRYRDEAGRPQMPYRARTRSSCCSCGCGPGGCSCGGCRAPARTVRDDAACEPTLMREAYSLELCESTSDDCTDLSKLLEGTLPMAFVDCLKCVIEFMKGRMRTASFDRGGDLYTTKPLTLAETHDTFCDWYRAVKDLYTHNPGRVHCQVPRAFAAFSCDAPLVGESRDKYHARVYPQLTHILALFVQYLMDCFCHALLPPCPPPPEDAGVTLACITVKGREVVRICNFSCRRFAGSFNSWRYWLPIGALLTRSIQQLCCRPSLIRVNSPITNDLETLFAAIDPTGEMREIVFADNMAVPRAYAARAQSVFEDFVPDMLSAVARPGKLDVATLVGKSDAEAKRKLESAGVHVTVADAGASSRDALRSLSSAPFAHAGERVTLRKDSAGKVVAWEKDDLSAEVEKLRAEVEALRATVSSTKKKTAAKKKSTAKKKTGRASKRTSKKKKTSGSTSRE